MEVPACAALLVTTSATEREKLRTWLDGDAINVAEGLPDDTDFIVCDPPGLQACAEELTEIRQAQHPRSLPVILLLPRESVLASLPSAERALVDKVVRVPVDLDELRLCVTSAMRTRFRSLEQERAVLFEQRLVGVVGHDMRTPLQMLDLVGGFMEEVESQLPQELQGAGARVTRAVGTLTQLADDLLLVAKGRSNTELVLDRATVDLVDVAERAIQMLPQRERATLESRGETSASVDSLRTVQLLVNLLQNAVRHGGPSCVELHVVGTADAVELHVINEGTIEPEQLDQLFEAFTQGDTQHKRAGSGLGLYIVRMIAAAHGGNVRATSRDGQVTFRVTLPRHPD